MTIDKAIILSAGKGSRLLPLTAERPKCLIELSGRSLLEWQLDALQRRRRRRHRRRHRLRRAIWSTRFAARRAGVRTLFNPFYHVADNLGSVWMARSELDRDTLLLNGDTLVSPRLLARVLDADTGPIAVTVDEKESYDADDMKVLRDGDRLLRIGKALEPGRYNAESIGLLAFRGEGPRLFADQVDADDAPARRHPPLVPARRSTPSPRRAPTSAPSRSTGEEWQEVDFPEDVEAAKALTARWAAGRSA